MFVKQIGSIFAEWKHVDFDKNGDGDDNSSSNCVDNGDGDNNDGVIDCDNSDWDDDDDDDNNDDNDNNTATATVITRLLYSNKILS